MDLSFGQRGFRSERYDSFLGLGQVGHGRDDPSGQGENPTSASRLCSTRNRVALRQRGQRTDRGRGFRRHARDRDLPGHDHAGRTQPFRLRGHRLPGRRRTEPRGRIRFENAGSRLRPLEEGLAPGPGKSPLFRRLERLFRLRPRLHRHRADVPEPEGKRCGAVPGRGGKRGCALLRHRAEAERGAPCPLAADRGERHRLLAEARIRAPGFPSKRRGSTRNSATPR